jgi:hypothetical protein
LAEVLGQLVVRIRGGRGRENDLELASPDSLENLRCKSSK